MQAVSFKRHRFPPDVIRQAVWLYFRFTLSFRDVEEMLAERGIETNYETIRCWALKFGRLFAQNLRRSRPKPTGRWHLDEMVVKISGKRMWLWRAVDDEGEVLDMLVQKRRNTKAAMRLFRKLLKNTGVRPETISTDRLASYRAAARELGYLSAPSTRTHDRQQPSGEFTSADSATRAKAKEVQISGFSPEIPRHPRRRLQHLQYPASPDHPTNASPPSRRCIQNVGRGDRRRYPKFNLWWARQGSNL